MPKLQPPEKSAILKLEPFFGVELQSIVVPRGDGELQAAWADLRAHAYLGFDTESKPTFVSGEVSTGPDVVQFATRTKAYIFQLRHQACEPIVRALLTDKDVVKVGFDLKQDQAQIRRRLSLETSPVLDLTQVFHRMGYPPHIGIKTAVAIVFGQRFTKSKKMATTNWANERLEPNQILYAANDAYVALRILQAVGLEEAGSARRPT
jgi:ribonuclease D